MTIPAGIQRKTKNNAKNERANTAWQKSKRENRPYQQYNSRTNTWGKITEPSKVTE
jgi:hypothetical protein